MSLETLNSCPLKPPDPTDPRLRKTPCMCIRVEGRTKAHNGRMDFRASMFSLVVLCCHGAHLSAQISPEQTRITHQGSRTTIVAVGARPLFQAVNALRDEYSWVVDYEDPIYSGSELVDDTSPNWRRLHPSSKGVTRLVCSSFVTSFDGDDAAAMQTSAGEEKVLRSVVRDYNAGARTERFELRRSASGRFTIVGLPKTASTGQQAPQSIMDTPISLELKFRSGLDAIIDVFATLSTQSGRKVVHFGYGNDPLLRIGTTLGGQNIPVRDFLEKVADSATYCMSFNALYDADPDFYGVSVFMTTRPSIDASGINARKPIRTREFIVAQDSETCGRQAFTRAPLNAHD
jgi:hypothetical protein